MRSTETQSALIMDVSAGFYLFIIFFNNNHRVVSAGFFYSYGYYPIMHIQKLTHKYASHELLDDDHELDDDELIPRV